MLTSAATLIIQQSINLHPYITDIYVQYCIQTITVSTEMDSTHTYACLQLTYAGEVFQRLGGFTMVHQFTLGEQCNSVKELVNGKPWLVDGEDDGATSSR